MSRLRALVPDVLRTEAEFRLLFAGQVLSLIGDRMMLRRGRGRPAHARVLAALYGTADAFFQPAFAGLLPQTVSHPGQLQPPTRCAA